MTVTLLPDAEKVLIGWATTNPDIVAIVAGRVGTVLNGTLPAIRVQRVGNAPPEVWEDDANVQIDCWAKDQESAHTLARTVVAALPSIRNTTVPGGRVYSYTITAGPFWSPDDPQLSKNSRYILSVSLLITT